MAAAILAFAHHVHHAHDAWAQGGALVTEDATPIRSAAPNEPAAAADSEPIEVVARTAMEPRAATKTLIDRESGRASAGAEGDATRALANAPGVARSSFGGGELVVWGASPEDTQVFVDGVPVPALYHLGGRRGIVATDAIESVELIPGAYGARWGRGTGGVVQVRTRRGEPRETGAALAVDTIDAGAVTWGALGDSGTVITSLRMSLLDRFADLVDDSSREVFAIPQYVDGSATLAFSTGEGETAQISFLGAQDELTRGRDDADPSVRRVETTRAGFVRVAARWEARRDDGTTTTIAPWVGFDEKQTSAQLATTSFGQAQRATRYGMRVEHGATLVEGRGPIEKLGLVGGLDVEGRRDDFSRLGSLALPRREGDPFAFGDAPGGDVAEEETGLDSIGVGAYLIAILRIRRVEIEMGLRLDHDVVAGDAVREPAPRTTAIGYAVYEPSVEPRVAVRVDLGAGTSVFAAGGLYHQAPNPSDRSPVFGTPILELARAVAASGGLRARPSPLWGFEIVGFGRYVDGLAVRSDEAFPRAGKALVPTGEARAFGTQIAASASTSFGLRIAASYTVSRSVRRRAPDESDRPFDGDQPHVATMLGDQTIGPLRLGLRFRVASGAPRTPVESAYFDDFADRYRPVYGRLGTERLPAFVQLDARAEVNVSKEPQGSFYLDVQNVTNHKNVEEIAYSSDYRERDDILGLPIFPVVGTRWIW